MITLFKKLPLSVYIADNLIKIQHDIYDVMDKTGNEEKKLIKIPVIDIKFLNDIYTNIYNCINVKEIFYSPEGCLYNIMYEAEYLSLDEKKAAKYISNAIFEISESDEDDPEYIKILRDIARYSMLVDMSKYINEYKKNTSNMSAKYFKENIKSKLD